MTNATLLEAINTLAAGLGTKRKLCPNCDGAGGGFAETGEGLCGTCMSVTGTVSAFPALEAWIGSWVGSPRRLVSIEAIAHILGPAFEWAVYGSLLRAAWADGLNSIGDEDDAEALVGAVTAAIGLDQ